MKTNPKISIIIPFYNVEKYIEECIKSVVNQTLKDIEIIFVNDGSTDGSIDIVNKYAKNDSRIKVLSLKERHGQGFARNRAIDIATGDYIGFVDSDDYVEVDMFEKLYVSAIQDDTDITMCLAKEYDDTTGEFIESDYYSLKLFEQYKEDVFSAEATKDTILDMNVALWNKLYKHSYLSFINEKFPEGFIFEDLPFFFGTYLPAKRVKILWECLYIYRINRKTSTMNQFGNKMLDRLPMVALTYEKLKKCSFFNDIKKEVQGWIINDIFHRYSLLAVGYQKEYFFSMKKLFINLEIENEEDEYWQRVFHFRGYLLVMNNSFEEFNQKVFYKYIDVNEIEDRFNSKILNIRTALATHGSDLIEADKRLSKIYDDIQENYRYTEKIVGNIDDKLDKCVDQIYKDNAKIYDHEIPQIYKYIEQRKIDVFSATSAKLGKIYDEINKNYKYTEKIVSESEARVTIELADKVSKIYEEFPKVYDYTNAAKEETYVKATERIDAIYDEITKNYKYTEKIVSDSEVKTESEFNEKITKVYDEITKVYDYVNQYKNYVYSNSEQSPEQIKVSITNSISTYFAEKHIDETVKNIYDELFNLKEFAKKCKEESIEESAKNLTPVYEDINKNYKYTEELVSGSVKETEIKTDNKISKIYEDFGKVYKYINVCKDESNGLTKDCTDKIYAYLSEVQENLKEVILESTREAKIEAYNNCEKLRNDVIEVQNKKFEEKEAEFKNIFDSFAIEKNEVFARVDNVEKNTAEKQIQNENAIDNLKKEIENRYGQIVISQVELQKDIDTNAIKTKEELNLINNQIILNQKKTENSINDIQKIFNNEIKNNTKTFINLYDELKKTQNENLVKTDNKIETLSGYLESEIKKQEEKNNLLNIKTDDIDSKIKQIHVELQNKIDKVEFSMEKQTDLKIKDVYSYTNNELSNIYNSFNRTNKEIQQDIQSKTETEDRRFRENQHILSEISKTVSGKANIDDFNKFSGSVSSNIETVKSDFEYKLSNIKTDYETKLQEQKRVYENKLEDLETKLSLLEEDYLERQKGLFHKLFARKKKKQI